MRTLLSSKRRRYLAAFAVLFTMTALIAGMVGRDLHPPSSRNLEIRTWFDLDAIRGNLTGNYVLLNDLDSTTAGYDELASPTANEGKGWQPIGTMLVDPYVNASFAGTFDGQGHEIRDLFMNRLGEEYVGLFGIVDEGGQLEDVSLVNVTVTGYWFVGGLAGANSGVVRECYCTSSVTGYEKAGGLVGINLGTVSNCYSSGNVTGLGRFVGGLMGENQGTVSNCYSGGNVTGETGAGWVGGLTGHNGGIVTNSYSDAHVVGWTRVGGLVGVNEWGTVSDCYSTGSVTGIVDVGGLVGINLGTVSNCYSSGNVTGHPDAGGNVGGLVGSESKAIVRDSFWDVQTSGQPTSGGGTGKSTAEMQDIATFAGAGWNIIAVPNRSIRNRSYTWNIVNGVTYPFLSWEP